MTMTNPTVTETSRDLEPVGHDPFIDDVSTDDAPLPEPPARPRRRIVD
jgi:hypothetical protein